MSNKKSVKKTLKRAVNEKMRAGGVGDFILLIFAGIGFGAMLSLVNSEDAFLVSYTILVTAGILSFLIYIIPKFIGSFKKQVVEEPPGFYLARGINGERPRLKKNAKVKLITMDL